EKFAVVIELLDAMVPGIGYIQIAVLVSQDARRAGAHTRVVYRVELPVAVTLTTERGDELAGLIELLESQILVVRDEEVGVFVNRDAARLIELPFVGTGRGEGKESDGGRVRIDL